MVSQVGGHLASSLGMVEVIVALLRVLDVPTDRIVYDVSHQAYPHKVCAGDQAGEAFPGVVFLFQRNPDISCSYALPSA